MALAPCIPALAFVGTAAIISGCTPAIHSAQSALYKISTGVNQTATVDQLAFLIQPSDASSNSAISPSVEVEFLTQEGAVDTSSTAVVTLAIGVNPSVGIISGVLARPAVGGIATFPGLSIDEVGIGYTLIARSSGVTQESSTAFNISAGSPSKLIFTTQPTSAMSGASLGGISVTVEDAAGNVVTSSSAPITLAVGTNAGPGGTLSGSLVVNAVSGVATFPGLNIDLAGVGYTLTASSGILTSATSSTFNISAAAANKLAFTIEPVNSAAMTTLPGIVVTVEDAAGNTVTSYSGSISLAISNNPSGGTLSGTIPETASSGVATFSDLSINYGGTGYTLVASATSGTPSSTVISTAFNLTAPIPTVFGWSGSTSFGSATCQAFTISAKNGGAPAAFTSATSVSLTQTGSGSFYGSTDSSCSSSAITSINFGAGVQSVMVYFKDPSVENLTLSSTASGVTGNTTVTSTGIYVLSSNVSTNAPGTPFALTITLENSLGVATPATSAITLNLWGVNYYSAFCLNGDSTCSNPQGNAPFTVNSGSSSTTFYFRDTRAEISTVYSSDTSGLYSSSPAQLTLTTQIQNVSSGSFVITGPTYVTPGECATYTITVTDPYQNVSPLVSSQTVALTTSGSGQFYGTSDTTCGSGPVTTVPINSGATTTTFHFMDNTVPDFQILNANNGSFTAVGFNASAVNTIPTISLGQSDATHCAIAGGDLTCWGDDTGSGMVGNSVGNYATLPSQVLGLNSGVTSVNGAATGNFVCAAANGGETCWGSAGYGATSLLPAEGSGVTIVASGASTMLSSCYVANGGVYCSGDDSEGELGDGGVGGSAANREVLPPSTGVTNLVGGMDSYCATVSSGMWCWGFLFGTTQPAIFLSGYTTAGLSKWNAYLVMGGQMYYQGSPYSSYVSGITKIAAGYEYNCALATGGTVWCWDTGENQNPTQVSGISGAIDVSADNFDTGCALFSDSTVKCWGTGYAGHIGNGTITDSSTPVTTGSLLPVLPLMTPSTATSVVVGCASASASGNTVSCTITGVTAGQTILVDLGYFNASNPVLTDSNTGTISTILGPTVVSVLASNGSDNVWVVKNAGAGTHVLTATFSVSPSYPGMTALLITGASTTSPIDGSSAVGNIYPGSGLCSSVTTTTPKDLLVTFVNAPLGATATPLSSPQNMTTGSGGAVPWAYGTADLAGSNYVTWSSNGNFLCDTIALH